MKEENQNIPELSAIKLNLEKMELSNISLEQTLAEIKQNHLALMNDNIVKNMPEIIRNISESMLNTFNLMDYSAMVQNLYKAVQQAIEPLTQMFRNFDFSVLSSLKFLDSYKVILLLGKNQYVYWELLEQDFIDEILQSKNIDKTLRICIVNNGNLVNEVIEKCKCNHYLIKHKRMFAQSVDAFNSGNCDIAVLGFLSIIDGLLSDTSLSQITNIAKRVKILTDKFENASEFSETDISEFALLTTFSKTTDLLGQSSDFNFKEPKTLNRHWIMHGRSTRRKTKLDCIKLINYMYGIVLLNELPNFQPPR